MRRLIDSLICILVTLCMFAMPMLLIGLAPWIGDSVLAITHITARRGFLAGIGLILLMMISAGGLLLVIVPAFAALYWPLARLSRFGTRFLSGKIRPRSAADDADTTPPGTVATRRPTTARAESVARPAGTGAVGRGGGARVHTDKRPPIASITPRGARPER